MMRTVSRRERRTLVIGAMSIAVTLAMGRGFPALLDWRRDVVASARELEAELARARAVVARLAVSRDSLAARKTRFLALAPMVLPANTSALAANDLAALVSTAAESAGVRVSAVQVLVDSSQEGVFQRAGVRVDAAADVCGLMALLRSLEGGPTLLAIREIVVSQPEPAAAPDTPEALNVTLTVEALAIRKQAAARP